MSRRAIEGVRSWRESKRVGRVCGEDSGELTGGRGGSSEEARSQSIQEGCSRASPIAESGYSSIEHRRNLVDSGAWQRNNSSRYLKTERKSPSCFLRSDDSDYSNPNLSKPRKINFSTPKSATNRYSSDSSSSFIEPPRRKNFKSKNEDLTKQLTVFNHLKNLQGDMMCLHG